ncbi:MAG: hypothetical protein V5A38_05855 [Halolamina sp.]|uniref:DUF7093 family protein n=1 Tax=Halolamina sp. TaxID=1940283 RepID=UPI002FC2A9D5
MGLRCLLGHNFGEPETERERNEEGNEVVVTVREVKTCQRCGEKQVVSENKEIKSIDQLRESANVGSPGEPATNEPSATGGADEWGATGSVGGGDEPTTTGQQTSGGADQWSTDELEVGGDSTDADPEEAAVSTDEPGDVDEGVAEIIESAEKNDEMIQTDEGERTAEPEVGEDETPADPDSRPSDEDVEEPDTPEEDAEILDDGSPPQEGREQWDEQADPSQVPGQGSTETESDAPDGEDAVIMGDDTEEPVVEEGEPEPTESEPADPEPSDEEPTAVESEDAVILDGESGDPEPSEPAETGDGAMESEDAVEESTEETGHTPWPETSGEDEGHDASEPDGEPADVEFGGGLTPDQPQNENNGVEAGASPESPASESSQSSADTASAGDDDSGGTQAPEPNINLEQSSREAQLEYYCSECGLTRDVGNSSMRAGDICPDCRKGYITERRKAE